jgi:hypothetical protein
MRRPSLLAGALLAACNTYEPWILNGEPGSSGVSGSSTAGTGGSPAGGAGGGDRGGTGALGGTSPAQAGGGGDAASASGEGGMESEAGAAGEASSGTGGGGSGGGGSGGDGGAASGGKSGGAAGSAGKGGAAAGGGGSSGGGAGASGSAGSGGAETCPGASGCARLSVPLAAAGDRTHFSIALGATVDFSTAVVSYRVRRVSATGGRVWAYVQHGGTPDFDLIYGGSRDLDQLGSDWTTVTWDIASTVPPFPFDKTVIARVGIEILASDPGPWTNPTVVDLDFIEVSGPDVGPWPFDDAASVSMETGSPGVFWMSDNDGELVLGSSLVWIP